MSQDEEKRRQQRMSAGAMVMWVAVAAALNLALSVYLLHEHHFPPSSSSFCDLSATISCTKVRESEYSELMRVPLAAGGVLFNAWLLALALAALVSHRQRDTLALAHFVNALLLWCALGLASVLYFIYAEIKLGAVCPTCTVVHLLTAAAFYASMKARKALPKQPLAFGASVWPLRHWLLAFALSALTLLAVYWLFDLKPPASHPLEAPPAGPTDPELFDFARCLTTNGWTFYGLSNCAWCRMQKEQFGAAFEHVTFVDCAAATDRCKPLKLSGYPTWIRTVDGVEVERQLSFIPVASFVDKLLPCAYPSAIQFAVETPN